MDPKALSVLADALRDALPEEDAADVLKWAQNPEAVRELLKHTPLTDGGDEPVACPACGTLQRVFQGSHEETCRVFLAWAALDDPRAAEAMGAAFDRARPVAAPQMGDWVDFSRSNPYVRAVEEMTPEQRDAEIERLSHLTYHEPTGVEVRASPMVNGGLLPFRLASEPEQAHRRNTPCDCDACVALEL